MSLFGKILAVLNILGAAAFVYFAFADFAKRESWAYTNYVYDVVVAGLPLDDTEKDNRENPVANYLTKETKKEWFDPDLVSTQVAEVDRVKTAVNAKVDALNGDPQTVELARVLTPFARHNDEREYLIALRTYLATTEDVDRLNKRMHDAFPVAVQAYQIRPDGLKFPQAFEEACRALGGAPAETFEQTFLKLLSAKPERTFEAAVVEAQKATADPKNPEQEAHSRAEAFLRSLREDPKATLRNLRDDAAKNKDTLDKVFQQTLTAVNKQLKDQLDELFDEARNGPKSLSSNSTDRLRDYQRVAIAHLLFNMVNVLEEGAAEKGVIGSPAYARVLSVVGLTAGLREINNEASLLQQIGEELEGSTTLERGEFTAAHRASIDKLQGRAVVLHDALDLLARKQQALDKEEETVRKRQDDVKKYEEELAAARAKSDKQIIELRKQSDSLYDLRIQGRDVLGENLDLERQLRDLEKNR
jgi:hypothetical protein